MASDTDSSVVTLRGLEAEVSVIFGEATIAQNISCSSLAAGAFSSPLSEEAYVSRDLHLAQRPLGRSGGVRAWCLRLAEDASRVVASCRTIHRDLLVNDSQGCRDEHGYCIASVVTDTRYRSCGLATHLLSEVARWLDGPGNAAASFLYTSIGDYYEKRGWQKQACYESTIWVPSEPQTHERHPWLPRVRLVNDEEMTELASRDVQRIRERFGNEAATPTDALVTILPTSNVLGWLHDQADFASSVLFNKTPQSHGAICPLADVWLYWYHNFRKEHLAIQRISVSAAIGEEHISAVASLLLAALKEAQEWELPKVVVWDCDDVVLRAMQLLADKLGVTVATEQRTSKSVTSMRWKGGNTSGVTLLLNEFYAWT